MRLKNFFKKVLIAICCFTFIIVSFPACGKVSEKNDVISKGQFFSLFIEKTNLTHPEYSNEEIEANEDYSIEAEIMVGWNLLDESQVSSIDASVTKEIVADACVNYMTFKNTTDEAIKDIELCFDQEAVKYAVGTGIFELEHGYFNGQEIMSKDECLSAIEKMNEVEANGHFEEGDLEIDYNDDVVNGLDIPVIDYSETTSETVENMECNQDKLEVSNLLLNSTNGKTTGNMAKSSSTYSVKISRADYLLRKNDIKMDKIFIFQGNTGEKDINNVAITAPTAMKVTSVAENGNEVTLFGIECDISEIIKDTEDGEGINAQKCISSQKVTGVKSKEIPEGIDLSFENGGVRFSYKYTFNMSLKTKNQTKYWYDSGATGKPTITISAFIHDFKIDVDNVGKLLLNKKAEALFKFSYHTDLKFIAESGGLRLSPANSGNGGLKYSPETGFTGDLFNNVKRSRVVYKDEKGSDKIKLAQINIPIGSSGFTVDANLYLIVSFDGSLSFSIEQDNAYEVKVEKTGWGKYCANVHNNSKSTSSSKLNVTFVAALELVPDIGFYRKSIVDASIKLEFNITAKAELFTEDYKESTEICANPEDLDAELKNSSLKYCIDINMGLCFSGSFLTTKSIIGKFVIGTLKLESPSIGKPIDIWEKNLHFEDGKYISSCSRKQSDDKAVSVNSDGEIELTAYKYNLDMGEMAFVDITSVPMSDADIERRDGIKVTSKDSSIASVSYDRNNKRINIVAEKVGSTEIIVKIKKSKTSKKYYEQQISITVSDQAVVQDTNIVILNNNQYKTLTFC